MLPQKSDDAIEKLPSWSERRGELGNINDQYKASGMGTRLRRQCCRRSATSSSPISRHDQTIQARGLNPPATGRERSLNNGGEPRRRCRSVRTGSAISRRCEQADVRIKHRARSEAAGTGGQSKAHGISS
jgi:hypothetical protein